VKVRLDLDESLDRAHPLAPLAIWNWQALVDQSEPEDVGPATALDWKEERLDGMDRDLRFFQSWNGELWDGTGEYASPRFRLAESDTQRLIQIFSLFRNDLFTALEEATVIDTQAAPRSASFLRLVVDNDNTVQP
jgi:hypothetical protein